MNTKKSLRYIYRFVRRPIITVSSVPRIWKMSGESGYFTEKKGKTRVTKFADNFKWLLKYGEVNLFYYLYGLNLRGSKPDNYIDNYHFMVSRDERNKSGKPDSQQVILRDKYIFYKYMKSVGMPVPEVFAIIKNGSLYDNNMTPVDESYLFNKENYFVKEATGECASFVKRISNYSEFKMVKPTLQKNCTFILQYAVRQDERMNVLNPNALNTLRIVTVNNNGKIYVLAALLRVGTQKTGNVDNWAKGGLAIGINPNGYLKKYGFYKPIFGKLATVHPDTNIEFSCFCIPDYAEAIKMAIKAHGFFYSLNTIGWDVALTDTGFVFIEGNDNWEMSLMQACDGGLRNKWIEAVSK